MSFSGAYRGSRVKPGMTGESDLLGYFSYSTLNTQHSGLSGLGSSAFAPNHFVMLLLLYSCYLY
jgi:hypothetical protein